MKLLFSISEKFSTNLTIRIFLVFIFGGLLINAVGQNTNFRAQGNYYSAKARYKVRDYTGTLEYINKSKTSLGGTNEELQYLHILASYNLEMYEEAEKELQTFFNIKENKVKPIYFDKEVDRLTVDETKELTMLMDPIFELADKKKNHKCNKCSGSGIMDKTVYQTHHCNNCANNDYSEYRVKYDDEYRHTKKGLQEIDRRGYTKKNCSKCNGKGLEVCSRCDGLGDNTCKGCVRNPTNPSGHVGFSFYCIECFGSGNEFTLCTVCKGTKTYTTSSSEKATCDQCKGRGF